MMPTEPTQPWIGPVSQNELGEALSVLYGRLPPDDCALRVEMLRAEFLSGRIPLEGLRVARREGRMVGVVFAQLQAGKTSVVWPPRLAPAEPSSTAEQLVRVTLAWLMECQTRVAHALLENEDPQDLAVLEATGFQTLATLHYMVSEESVLPRRAPPMVLQFEPYASIHHERLVRILEATYEGTLDCPALDGVRPIEDVIEGYRATGVFSPERWFIVCHQGHDVGCLLLTEHPDAEIWELIYMGLIPSARGSGWGVEVSHYAQWLTRQAGQSRLVVAVDAANTPAIRMYTAAGFALWDRRIVLQRVFG